MATMYSLTPEDLQKIKDFIENGNTAVFETDAINTFSALHAAMTKRLASAVSEKNRKIASLERRMARQQKREEEKIAIGDFTESTRDSADVAYMLIYHLQQLDVRNLTKNKVIYILYLMYASWLYSKKERFFVEHPCATEWGPQFWRVYGRIDVKYKIPYQEYHKLAHNDPASAAFCKSAATKYHDYLETHLKAMLLKSFPYKNALPNTNGGKWNKEIADVDIFNWKQENDKASK